MTNFETKYRGSFTSLLRWPQLDAFWTILTETTDKQWYIYAVGESPPGAPVSQEKLTEFVRAIDQLLHKDHQEDYCGIVYADDLQNPQMIKIYDPNHLGISCGFSDQPPLPGWLLSVILPIDLQAMLPPSKSRHRWWQKLF